MLERGLLRVGDQACSPEVANRLKIPRLCSILSLEVAKGLVCLPRRAEICSSLCERFTGCRTEGGGRGSSSGALFVVGTRDVVGNASDSSGCITFCVNSSKDDFIFLWTIV